MESINEETHGTGKAGSMASGTGDESLAAFLGNSPLDISRKIRVEIIGGNFGHGKKVKAVIYDEAEEKFGMGHCQ